MKKKKNNYNNSKVAIFTWHDVKNAYACLLYLGYALNDYRVDIWAKTNSEDIPLKYRSMVRSFFDLPFGRIKGLRFVLVRIYFLFIGLKYKVVIINDIDFFFVGYLLKRINPKIKVIHYNTEIYGGKDIVYSKIAGIVYNFEMRFYRKNASYPDMIIECLPERANFRKNKYNINKNVYTINNTLPKDDLIDLTSDSIDVSMYFDFDNDELPTAIYAGGSQLNKNLKAIIDSSYLLQNKMNFILMCYGTKNEMDLIRKECSGRCNCKVFDAVDKRVLFQLMKRCDVGIQLYEPRLSINHFFASPSKFYEYLGNGLNVISTNNRGINNIIKEGNLGVVIKESEDLLQGINRLLNKGLESKEHIIEYFNENLCYEVDSKETIMLICKILDDL